MTTRTPVTRQSALRFNPRWNDRDRSIIADDFDRFEAVEFIQVESGWDRHVGAFDDSGELILDVSKGTIYYKGGRSRDGAEAYDEFDTTNSVFRLSTHSAGSRSTKRETPLHETCSVCFLTHPAGECDR